LVTIHIPAPLRSYSGGREAVAVAGGGSLRQVFGRLEAECPGISERIMLEGDIHPAIAVFIDDEQISQGLIEHVPETATIRLLPALGGG
jgi:molybdopterin converting factor small subunit